MRFIWLFLIAATSCRGVEQVGSAGLFPIAVERGSCEGISGVYFSDGVDIPLVENEEFGAYTGLDGVFFEPSGGKGGYVGGRGKLGVEIGVIFLEVGHGGGYRDGESWGRPVDYTFLSDITAGVMCCGISIGLCYLHFSWGRDKLKMLGFRGEGPNPGFESIGVIFEVKGGR